MRQILNPNNDANSKSQCLNSKQYLIFEYKNNILGIFDIRICLGFRYWILGFVFSNLQQTVVLYTPHPTPYPLIISMTFFIPFRISIFDIRVCFLQRATLSLERTKGPGAVGGQK